jgi:transposase-like protein
MQENITPETLQEAITLFADPKVAHDFLASIIWGNGKPKCAHCGSTNVGKFSGKRMVSNCKECKKQFTVKMGTIFAESPLPLSKWLPAVWLIVNAKNGISSYELGRSLGVTQKTGWFMLHRIRLAMQNGTLVKIGGEVEVDETCIGGKARNMHAKKRRERVNGKTGGMHMTPVQGLLQRHGTGSKVILKAVKTTRRAELQGNIVEYVLKGSKVFTDAAPMYKNFADNPDYTHEVIDHAECYAKGKVYTNGLENFWSLLKRGIKGTYVSVEPFHLFRYLDEQAFRFNERKDSDAGRFMLAMKGIIGKGLRYVDLIGKGGDDLQQAVA